MVYSFYPLKAFTLFTAALTAAWKGDFAGVCERRKCAQKLPRDLEKENLKHLEKQNDNTR